MVGAGAAGIFAALHAARRGLSVLVLEAGPAAGRKILASGNGRCNVTNINAAPDRYFGGRNLVSAALDKFAGRDAVEFFKSLGILLVEEEGGRIFPRADKSSAILTPLTLAAAQAGATTETGVKVSAISRQSGQYSVNLENGARHSAKNVLLACGSPAAPGLGGSASGFELARSLGHKITPCAPALVPLCVKEKGAARLAGIRTQAALSATAGGKEIYRSRGELLFTPYGISGPAVLNISGPCALALASGKVFCDINLFPEYAPAEFEAFLRARLTQFGLRPFKHFFSGMLHESVANLAMDIAGLDRNAPAQTIGDNGVKTLIKICTAWRLEITGTRPLAEAMAMAGGVSAAEVNPSTMESRISPGLYFAGEMIEPVGESGGFNLQFAWASGFIAGTRCPPA